MSETNATSISSNIGEALTGAIREAVREELREALDQNTYRENRLLTADELAEHLKVPVSWVYEQSRQGNIPTHRIGRYIRFDFHEVIESQKIH